MAFPFLPIPLKEKKKLLRALIRAQRRQWQKDTFKKGDLRRVKSHRMVVDKETGAPISQRKRRCPRGMRRGPGAKGDHRMINFRGMCAVPAAYPKLEAYRNLMIQRHFKGRNHHILASPSKIRTAVLERLRAKRPNNKRYHVNNAALRTQFQHKSRQHRGYVLRRAGGQNKALRVWTQAVAAARAQLGITGMAVVKRGTALYNLARQIYLTKRAAQTTVASARKSVKGGWVRKGAGWVRKSRKATTARRTKSRKATAARSTLASLVAAPIAARTRTQVAPRRSARIASRR